MTWKPEDTTGMQVRRVRAAQQIINAITKEYLT